MNKKTHHKSLLTQIPIFLGKFFRMFVYMDDWKVIPMAIFIAGLVGYVIGGTMFVTMEGTLKGALAVACVCIWNGCFNSIQVVCRERGIIKREHRSGMHISSYIAAHMIYQAFLCLLQTGVTLVVFYFSKLQYPKAGLITPYFITDFAITLFLITYAADILSLLLSCLARTTTAAMTLMPFLLIFELVFSGTMFSLSGTAAKLTNLSIAKWGIQGICVTADYNELTSTSAWRMLLKMQDYDYNGTQPIKEIVKQIKENDEKDEFCKETAKSSQRADFAKTDDNLKDCWFYLIIFTLVEALASVLVLLRIDKDKR